MWKNNLIDECHVQSQNHISYGIKHETQNMTSIDIFIVNEYQRKWEMVFSITSCISILKCYS